MASPISPSQSAAIDEWDPITTDVAWQLYPVQRVHVEESSRWIYVERDA